MSNSNVLIKKFKNGSVTLHSPLKYDKSVGDINNWIDTYYSDDMFMEDLSIWTDNSEDVPYLIDINKGLVYDLENVGVYIHNNILLKIKDILIKDGKIKLMPVTEEYSKAILQKYWERW